MTGSKKAKQIGLKSLVEVSEITGKPRTTLEDWSNHQPKLFNVILEGCLAIKSKDKE